jgi:hypothetical protein
MSKINIKKGRKIKEEKKGKTFRTYAENIESRCVSRTRNGVQRDRRKPNHQLRS